MLSWSIAMVWACVSDGADTAQVLVEDKAFEEATCREGYELEDSPYGELCCRTSADGDRLCISPQPSATCRYGETRVETMYDEWGRTCTGTDCSGAEVRESWRNAQTSRTHQKCESGVWKDVCSEFIGVERTCSHVQQTCTTEVCGSEVQYQVSLPRVSEPDVYTRSNCGKDGTLEPTADGLVEALGSPWMEVTAAPTELALDECPEGPSMPAHGDIATW